MSLVRELRYKSNEVVEGYIVSTSYYVCALEIKI